MENKLLSAAFHDREAFDQLLSADVETDLSDKGKILWKLLKEYYSTDAEAPKADVEVISHQIERQYPKHVDTFKVILDSLEQVSIPNIIKDTIEFKIDATKHQLAHALTSGKDEYVNQLIDKLQKLREGRLKDPERKSEVLTNVSVADLVKRSSAENRIKVLPSALNEQIGGGVSKQHHIVVFAPTDMGKSLFALNMTYGFLKQGLKVLYGGNEDPADDLIYRLLWRMTGMPKEEIEKDFETADKLAAEKGYHNLVFAELAPGNPTELRDMIEEHQPDVLIVDQIRNLDMGETNRVLQLEKAATMMRNFGKQYNLLPVSMTQAADSATGQVILSRGDIDYSNVGIPGQADLLIGIGADEDMEMKGERMLSFVKNKINGQKTPLKVWFDPTLTKVT